jgi:hypothetical protein
MAARDGARNIVLMRAARSEIAERDDVLRLARGRDSA